MNSHHLNVLQQYILVKYSSRILPKFAAVPPGPDAAAAAGVPAATVARHVSPSSSLCSHANYPSLSLHHFKAVKLFTEFAPRPPPLSFIPSTWQPATKVGENSMKLERYFRSGGRSKLAGRLPYFLPSCHNDDEVSLSLSLPWEGC